eukprot:7840134-Karenia_brevis.AAC.1
METHAKRHHLSGFTWRPIDDGRDSSHNASHTADETIVWITCSPCSGSCTLYAQCYVSTNLYGRHGWQ